MASHGDESFGPFAGNWRRTGKSEHIFSAPVAWCLIPSRSPSPCGFYQVPNRSNRGKPHSTGDPKIVGKELVYSCSFYFISKDGKDGPTLVAHHRHRHHLIDMLLVWVSRHLLRKTKILDQHGSETRNIEKLGHAGGVGMRARDGSQKTLLTTRTWSTNAGLSMIFHGFSYLYVSLSGVYHPFGGRFDVI